MGFGTCGIVPQEVPPTPDSVNKTEQGRAAPDLHHLFLSSHWAQPGRWDRNRLSLRALLNTPLEKGSQLDPICFQASGERKGWPGMIHTFSLSLASLDTVEP